MASAHSTRSSRGAARVWQESRWRCRCLEAMGKEVAETNAAAVLRDVHRQRHVPAESKARHQRVELVSDDRRAETFEFGKSTEPLAPVPRRSSASWAGLYHPNGTKADPHLCSDMWLTGAPLHNPKPGTFNSVALDQVVALHTKQYCRQPSLVLSIDAGVGFLSRTGTISYNLEGKPIPAENNPRRVFDRLFRGDRSSLAAAARAAANGGSSWWTPCSKTPSR